MTYVDTGVQGAKRQSYRAANPREILKRLIDANPDASEDEIREMHWEKVIAGATFKRPESESLIRVIHEYWMANNYRSLINKTASLGRPVSADRPKRLAAVRAEGMGAMQQQLVQKVEEKAQIILLDLMMPTGKLLRDTTREELIEIGGWQATLIKRMKPGQIVGAVFTEKQLHVHCPTTAS